MHHQASDEAFLENVALLCCHVQRDHSNALFVAIKKSVMSIFELVYRDQGSSLAYRMGRRS